MYLSRLLKTFSGSSPMTFTNSKFDEFTCSVVDWLGSWVAPSLENPWNKLDLTGSFLTRPKILSAPSYILSFSRARLLNWPRPTPQNSKRISCSSKEFAVIGLALSCVAERACSELCGIIAVEDLTLFSIPRICFSSAICLTKTYLSLELSSAVLLCLLLAMFRAFSSFRLSFFSMAEASLVS